MKWEEEIAIIDFSVIISITSALSYHICEYTRPNSYSPSRPSSHSHHNFHPQPSLSLSPSLSDLHCLTHSHTQFHPHTHTLSHSPLSADRTLPSFFFAVLLEQPTGGTAPPPASALISPSLVKIWIVRNISEVDVKQNWGLGESQLE